MIYDGIFNEVTFILTIRMSFYWKIRQKSVAIRVIIIVVGS